MPTKSPLKKAAEVLRKKADTFSTNNDDGSMDWHDALKQAKQGKVSTHFLASFSSSWVTCACGNQCAIIPRDSDGAPVDTKLRQLGIDFHNLIKDEKWDKAENVLKDIEKRSTVLIEQELKKLQGLGLKISIDS